MLKPWPDDLLAIPHKRDVPFSRLTTLGVGGTCRWLFEPVEEAQAAAFVRACAREGLNESECVGRLIWFKATGGNERFHTYTFQQRVGVLVDWFRVLRSDQRDDRFWAWGIINARPAASPASPTARQSPPTRLTASTGAPATTCC